MRVESNQRRRRSTASLLTAFVLAFAVVSPAHAEPRSGRTTKIAPDGRNIGFGFQLGAPTAVVGKAMLRNDLGISGGIGAGTPWILGPTLSLHTDLVWHPVGFAIDDALTLSPYLGVGAQAGLAPFEVVPNPWFRKRHPVAGYRYIPGPFPVSAAARVPLGLSLAIHPVPIEIYGELTPSLLVFPALGGGVGGTVGVRGYID